MLNLGKIHHQEKHTSGQMMSPNAARINSSVFGEMKMEPRYVGLASIANKNVLEEADKPLMSGQLIACIGKDFVTEDFSSRLSIWMMLHANRDESHDVADSYSETSNQFFD